MAMNGDKAEDSNGYGVLVIRAWTEPGHERALRIRMTFTEDPSTEPTTVVTAETEQAVSALRSWLARLQEPRS